jgi:hypothetical protein
MSLRHHLWEESPGRHAIYQQKNKNYRTFVVPLLCVANTSFVIAIPEEGACTIRKKFVA